MVSVKNYQSKWCALISLGEKKENKVPYVDLAIKNLY